MRKAAVIGGIWLLVVIGLFFVGARLYEWDALDRQRDGWCELQPLGRPSADDPDCEGWNADDGSSPAPSTVRAQP